MNWRSKCIGSAFEFRNALELFCKRKRKSKTVTTTYCKSGCCSIKKIKYVSNQDYRFVAQTKNANKAGVLLFDSSNNSVLLVQSAGNFFGLPKGSIEENETVSEAASREVFEETGINVSNIALQTAVKFKPYNNQTYFLIDFKQTEVDVQETEGNDANGITWIKLDCLRNQISNGNMKLNNSSKLVLKHFLNFL